MNAGSSPVLRSTWYNTNMNKIIQKLNDPHFTIKFHYSLLIFFILMIPVSVTVLANSVPYLVALSVWALIAGHWGAAQASHAEISERSGLDNEDLDKKLDRVIALLEQQKPPEAERCL